VSNLVMRGLTLIIGLATLTQGPIEAALHQSQEAFVLSATAESPLPETCEVGAIVTGNSGGFGGSQRKVQPGNGHQWIIPTRHEGSPANVLRAYLYCPGFHVETVQVPDLRSHSTRRMDVGLRPLRALPFEGRIVGALPEKRDGLEIVASFSQLWSCEFFRLAECGFSPWTIATAPLDRNFSMQLPDFLNDEAVGTAKVPGHFSFVVRNKASGNRPIDLVPANSASPSRLFPPKRGYSGVQIFQAVERK
jgi:hypothetical protein